MLTEIFGYGQWLALALILSAGLAFIFHPYFFKKKAFKMWRGFGVALIALYILILLHTLFSELMPDYF